MSTTQETLSQAVETGMPLSPAAYGAKLIREQWGADIDPQTAQLVTLDYNYHGHPAVDGVEQGQVHSQQPLIQALLLNYQGVGDNRFFETAFGFYTPPAIGPAVKIVEHVDELAFHGAGNHDSYEGIYRRTDPQTYGPQTQLPVTPAAFKQWAWRLELTTVYTRYLNTTWPSDDTIKARPPYAVRTSVKTAFVMAAFLQKNAGSLSMAGLQLALLSAGVGDNQVRFSYINSAQLEHWTRPMDTVQVSRLVIYRYTARDLWVFTHRSSGLTLLYVPGNSSPLHEFADLNALRAWVVQQAGDPLKKTALATHFAKDDRGDGTFHAGVQTALEAMLVYPKRHHLTRNAGFFNDDGYWNPQQYISLADEPQTTDPFADLVAVMKQMSFEDVQDSIRDDAQVNRDNLSAIVEPTVRWLNQWGALALFFPGGEGVLGLAGLIEAGYGVSEVVNATGADERNEGVTRTVFGVLNALPLFLKAAHGVPEAQVPEVKPTAEPEPVASDEHPPTPTVDAVVQSITDLTRPQLMRGLGPAVEPFTDEVLEQVRKVSGVSDDNLRVMYAEHRAPRGLLADTLDRFKIDQDLQAIIEQLRNGLHPDIGPAQLMQWVTQDPAWPVEQGVRLTKDNKVLWEYVGVGSTHEPLMLQVTNNDMLKALLRRLEFSQTRALIGEVAEGSAPLPDLSTQVQLLRKKLASRLQRQRPQLFEARYRALQKTDRDVLLYLHLEHPSLSRVLLEELLSAEHLTGEEHLTLRRIKALLKELETRGQSLETSVRQARAYEGLFLESVRNVDSDTLLLHTVERMPGWSGRVCIEVREGSFNGRVLDRIGFKSAAQKRYLVKTDTGYQLYDDTAHNLHPPEPFADAVLHALPEAERTAMRLHVDDGLPNFMRKVRQQALSPNDLNTVLARQQLRTPFFDPDDGGLKGGAGANVTVGAQALANEVMRSSVKAFYPDFTDAMADEFWARFGHDGAPAELTRLKAEYVKLESELEAWVNDTSTAPDEIVELTDADWERAGEFIDDDSESEDDGSYEWSKSNDDRIQRHGSILEREIVQPRIAQWIEDNRKGERAVADQLKKCFKWQGAEADRVYENGKWVGLKLEILNGNTLRPALFWRNLPKFSGIASLKITGMFNDARFVLRACDQAQHLILIETIGPDLFSALPHMEALKTLRIERCGLLLIEDTTSEFEHLTQLRWLSLDGNPLMLPPSVLGLSHLEHLSLASTQITACPFGIADRPYLKWLDLRGNRITEVPDEVFKQSRVAVVDPATPATTVILDRNPLAGRPTLERLIHHRRSTGIDLWNNLNAPRLTLTDWLEGMQPRLVRPRSELWTKVMQDPRAASIAERFGTLGQSPDYLFFRGGVRHRVWAFFEAFERADELLKRHLSLLAKAKASHSSAALLDELEASLREYDVWKRRPAAPDITAKRPRVE